MELRRAVPGDEEILRGLRLQALSEAPGAFGSTYERELSRTKQEWQQWIASGVTFILGDRGIVAGRRDADDALVVHLMAMWLHPEDRGSGAADTLVAAILAWARTEGATVVRLEVMQANMRARRFYERNGFRQTGHETVHERSGQLELKMERWIESELGASR